MRRKTSRDYRLKCLQLRSTAEAAEVLKKIEVDPYGIEAMLFKMVNVNILLEGVECKVANIIKQEMLSIGGDAAVSRYSVSCSVRETDVVIIGTVKQINRFAEKISSQPFGLVNIYNAIKQLLTNIEKDQFILKTYHREMIIGERTLIMGILNVTPDSFSDGGRFMAPEEAIEHGMKMVENGADIIDIGGESSRPGAEPVSCEEEMARVIPVIKGLAMRINVPVSIDTTRADVAREAIEYGAEIVNDISAVTSDDQMKSVIAGSGAAVILMHMRGKPKDMQKGDLSYRSIRGDIIEFLKEQIAESHSVGIPVEGLMIDPGFGFGKTGDDNVRLLKYLAEFRMLGRPIVAGVSRKAFIGRITGGEPSNREEGTAAAVTAAIMNGANVVRVHDVGAMKKVAAMADAIVRA
ncbi:MAG: dihydropteroate synthase [Deltaproteobacteria bacterium]|nr:dihydropteroate synthase [Deltaproteobacteria bacterium]